MRHFCRFAVWMLIAVNSAGPLRAQGIANWTAPPFWSPDTEGALEKTKTGTPGIWAQTLPSSPVPLIAITPCRVADTRGNGYTGQYGPPALAGGVPRTFTLVDVCGIPSTALAVSANITVTDTQGPGFILIYPAGGSQPTVSTLNYLAGQTVANAAVIPLGSGGGATFIAGVSGTHLIIDVNGYYAPAQLVNSLNSLSGNVSLAGGTNISISPSANTLTVGFNGLLPVALGGTGAATALAGRASLGAAASGANSDISSLSGLLTPLSVAQGGTGGASASSGRANLGAAGSGANSDITSLSGLTTPLSLTQGGTGSSAPFTSSFQARVSGNCAAGNFIQGVNSDGTVVCATGPAGRGSPCFPDPVLVGTLRWDLLYADFAVGSQPQDVAFDGANIWVTNQASNNVTKLRASDGVVLGTFAVGTNPRGIAFDGANIWVANLVSNNVTKLRASDGVVQGTFAIGSSPVAVAFDGANIWVGNGGSNNVTKLRASDGALLGTFAVGSTPVAVAFDGANIWVANASSNNVTKLRASDGVVLGTFAVGTNPRTVAFDGANIWVANASSNNMTKLRASDGELQGTFAVGISPLGVAFDGANIWVANQDSNTVSKRAISCF